MQKRINIKHFGLVVLIFLGFVSKSQELKSVTSKYAITGATIIVSPNQKIENGTIIFEDGIIKNIGTNIKVPYDAIEISGKDKFIYPGFISGASSAGVKNPKNERSNFDRRMTGNPPYKRAGITPEENVKNRLNNKSGNLKGVRKLGFTTVQAVPDGGMIAGQSAIVLTTDELPILKENYSMFCQLKGAGGVYPNTVIGVMAKFRDLYKKAEQNRKYSYDYNINSTGKKRPTDDAVLRALSPVTYKKMPVLFKAQNIRDILRVMDLQKELGFKMIITDLKQGWDLVSQIKSKNYPVFFSLDLPKKIKEKDDKKKEDKDEKKTEEQVALEKRKKETIEKYYSQFEKFQKEGVLFGFTDISSKSKNFKKTVREIIKSGLTEEQMLAALTINPAKILGVSSMMGDLKVGKMANLVVTDKPYFEKKSKVKYVFVEGKEFKIESKNKKKSDKKVNFAGNWKYKTNTGDGESTGTIKLKKEKDTYSGTVYVGYTQTEQKIKDVEVDGATLRFSFDLTIEGNTVQVKTTMNVDGEEFDGNFDAPGLGNFALEGNKEPENN